MLSVNVPFMLAISCYTEEFQRIVYEIEKFCEKDEILYARIKNKLDFPFYQIM